MSHIPAGGEREEGHEQTWERYDIDGHGYGQGTVERTYYLNNSAVF